MAAPKLEVVVGTPGAPSFQSNDEGLRLARDLFGDGSALYFAAESALVEDVAGRFFHSPRREWLALCDGFAAVSPVLGALVRRRVYDRMIRLAFEPLGEWLEKRWPWLFEEVPDQDDALVGAG